MAGAQNELRSVDGLSESSFQSVIISVSHHFTRINKAHHTYERAMSHR